MGSSVSLCFAMATSRYRLPVFGGLEECALRVHLEDAAVLESALVLGDEVEVQVAARVAVGAVVHLLRVERRVQGAGDMGDVVQERAAVLVGEVDHLAHVELGGDDDAAAVALLLEEVELGGGQLADLDAEGVEGRSLGAVGAVGVGGRRVHGGDSTRTSSRAQNRAFVAGGVVVPDEPPLQHPELE